MTNLAILGGSFDPIHKGHLFLLHEAICNSSLEKIIVVPTSINNFKRDLKTGATTQQRLEMVKLALSEYSEIYPNDRDIEILLDDCEIKREGISYTYDTVLDIKKRYDVQSRLGVIVGDDIIPTLNEWYKADELFDLVEFFICRRLKIEPSYSFLKKNIVYNKMKLTGNIFVGSSSEFRKKNLDILTPKVYDYVKKNDLYC